jgi:hypothetical protein
MALEPSSLCSFREGEGTLRTIHSSAFCAHWLNIITQSSGEIGHSLATDLLDEFGPNGDVRDALAVLYSGKIFNAMHTCI